MKYRLCLHGNLFNENDIDYALSVTGGEWIEHNDCLSIGSDRPFDDEAIKNLQGRFNMDINRIPETFDPGRIKLVISDMDSTFVNIECIDEIADMLGIKPQVAAITESAMRGEIDFSTALRQRVALLKGLDVDKLHQVYEHRLQLNPGVDVLLAELKKRGIKLVLVSGGFTFFTDRLQQRYHLYGSRANVLEIIDGRLTGRVKGKIVDASRKADFLVETCNRLSIDTDQAIAVGDGANDLKMMASAGLSVAFHAKPAVQERADICLNHSGMDGICDLLTLPREIEIR